MGLFIANREIKLILYIDFYPASLLNLFISSNSFIVDCLGFSLSRIMSYGNRDIFTSSFPNWMPFISFSCLTALASASNTMLNRSGNSRRCCLVPDLKGLFYRCLLCTVGLYYFLIDLLFRCSIVY